MSTITLTFDDIQDVTVVVHQIRPTPMNQRDIKKKLAGLENDIVDELDRLLRGYMVTLAVSHPIPGYDVEDLLQEMRFKMWDKIRQGKYDPNRTKPITYFSWVFRTTLYNLAQYHLRNCRIDATSFADSLDDMIDDRPGQNNHANEYAMLKHHDTLVFCDLCSGLIDPHSNYHVFTRRVTDPSLICEPCLLKKAVETLEHLDKYT